MKTNLAIKADPIYTAPGARASRITPLQQLERSVMSCMLWESAFYEDGESVADRIKTLVHECDPVEVARLAITARERMNLRHVPLLLVRELARHKGKQPAGNVANTLARVIQRADELAEFVSIYWADSGVKPPGKQPPLSNQVKLGLAEAFGKFNEYHLGKYDRDAAVRLRDVLFLCHAKARDDAQAALWKRLIDGKLATPDTWEVRLSGGADKAATFAELMATKKLGGLAFLRNLRNMRDAGVDKGVVAAYARTVPLDRVLPFRYVAAARVVPEWEDILDELLLRACASRPKLPGKTVVIVDVSGSMTHGKVSAKSDMSRLDAAGALAAILRESCDDCRLYATAGNDGRRIHATMAVPPRRGMALVEQFSRMMFSVQIGQGGIFLKQVMDYVAEKEGGVADNVIVLTDEQDCDTKANPENANAFGASNYLINVSIEKNGIAYSKFTHINGWSESVIDFIGALTPQQ